MSTDTKTSLSREEIRNNILEILREDQEKTGFAHGGNILKKTFKSRHGICPETALRGKNALAGMINQLRKKHGLTAPSRGRTSSKDGPKIPSGKHTRIQTSRISYGGLHELAADHPAIVEGRTLFPTRVRTADFGEDPLKSGHNSTKLGKVVTKGKWKGFPIFSLTLEERKTCPITCHFYAGCFGNNMHLAIRYNTGPLLENRINLQLKELDEIYPNGFVVRLHILGDFYSVEYVKRWEEWIHKYPGLHVFGYTNWDERTKIGAAVRELREKRWHRFAIRTSRASSHDGEREAIGVPDSKTAEKQGAIVCPATTKKTEVCGTCALCWGSDKNIAFLFHGKRKDSKT